MTILDILGDQFNNQIKLLEKRPGIQQVFAPLYHEDGDMISIFLDIPKNADIAPHETIRISDHGLTLMRLSYSFEIDTPNKERIFQKILAENGVSESDGVLFIETIPESLYPALMQFSHTIAKICNMRQFKREVLNSLFEEMLDDLITNTLKKYNPQGSVFPLLDRDDLEVDYQLKPNGIPYYLFGVKDNAQARLATIACLEFQKARLPFKSVIVHEDFDKLSRKDRTRLTSACDKQFPSLQDFQINSIEYFERELSHLKSHDPIPA